MFAIAETLTAEGVPTPKRAMLWGHTTIRALITQRLYIGEVKYAGIVHAQPELAIVGQETFDAARARMGRNKEQGRRNRKADYLLAGFIRCYCGRAVCRIASRSRQLQYHYYKCGGYKSGHEKKCENYYLRDEVIEALVLEAVTRGLSREVLIEGLRAKEKVKAAELNPKRERLAALDELMAKLDRKITRYLAKFGEEENETLAAEAEYMAREASRQREALERERERLALELREYAFTEEEQSAIVERAEALRQKVTNGKPTLAQKREFLRALDLRVTICKGHQEMNVSYILGDTTLQIEYSYRTFRERQGM